MSSYATQAHGRSTVDFLLHIIPIPIADAFSKGEVLQLLLAALLFSAWARELDRAPGTGAAQRYPGRDGSGRAGA